jgi:hypothetical protein
MRRVSIRLSSADGGTSVSLEDYHEDWSRGLMTCSKFLVMTLMLVLIQLCPVCAQPASTTAGCKEESARFAVGELYSDELAERARRAAGADVVRKTVPGGADTMELRADRLNLDVDRNGRIQRVRCG